MGITSGFLKIFWSQSPFPDNCTLLTLKEAFGVCLCVYVYTHIYKHKYIHINVYIYMSKVYGNINALMFI